VRIKINHDDPSKLRDFSDGASYSKRVNVLMNRAITASETSFFHLLFDNLFGNVLTSNT
jgi:hypothetical protein